MCIRDRQYALGEIDLETYRTRKAVYDTELVQAKNVHAVITAPVSYTHLDVYKRQDHNGTSSQLPKDLGRVPAAFACSGKAAAYVGL